MFLPIVIIHKGDSLYLWYVISQAKYFNPDSEIFLIGDEQNAKYKNIVNHCFVSEYMKEAEEFSRYYKHCGPNNYQFELFCIQRWFILHQFMKKKLISKCFHIDSDVLLYANVSKAQADFKKFDFTLNNGRVGHCMFINNVDGLGKFCRYVMNLYKNKSIEELAISFREYLATKDIGGISDMSLLNAYYKKSRSLVGDTFNVVNNAIFDHNINVSDGFEMRKKIKKIFFKKTLPFGTKINSKKIIQFKCLHFQGVAKKNIPFYFTNKNVGYYFQIFRTIFSGIIGNIFKKLG